MTGALADPGGSKDGAKDNGLELEIVAAEIDAVSLEAADDAQLGQVAGGVVDGESAVASLAPSGGDAGKSNQVSKVLQKKSNKVYR